MFKGIDLYSDTVTKPTSAMKKAMMEAEIGDEQRSEDPTTRRLEEIAAETLGLSAAMFFPTATMANEIALRLLSQPGDELIAAENCHLFFAEAGGPAIFSGLMARPLSTKTGIFNPEDLRAIYRWNKGPHYPVSKCVSVENTTNMGGGIAWEPSILSSVVDTAKQLGLFTHLDGSRLFNAVVRTELPAHKLVMGFDTVTICLSKGLGCPMGALLAFPQKDYDKVRRLKQLWGGAMRQSGILAAAGIYALNNHVQRLHEDHENATLLAQKMDQEITQIQVENISPSTNMVFFKWFDSEMTAGQFNKTCLQKGLRFSQVGENRFRAVTHLDVSRKDIEDALLILKEITH